MQSRTFELRIQLCLLRILFEPELLLTIVSPPARQQHSCPLRSSQTEFLYCNFPALCANRPLTELKRGVGGGGGGGGGLKCYKPFRTLLKQVCFNSLKNDIFGSLGLTGEYEEKLSAYYHV